MEGDSQVALINIELSDDEPEVIVIPQDALGDIYVVIKVGSTNIKMKVNQANVLREGLPTLDDDGIIIETGHKLDAMLDRYGLYKRYSGETDEQVRVRIIQGRR